MKRLISIMMSGICAFGIASQVVAISISLQPSSQTIGVGGNASVAVVISDLGNFASPSLGGFDFDLTYDSSIISAISLVSGSHLDLGVLGSIQNSDLSTPGGIHLDELSFESESDLNANQPATFTLVTLGFTGLAPGSSILAFTFAALSDEAGASISDRRIDKGQWRPRFWLYLAIAGARISEFARAQVDGMHRVLSRYGRGIHENPAVRAQA